MEYLVSLYIIPLGAFVTAIFMVAFESISSVRENELETYRTLRIREMNHLCQLKKMEVQHSQASNHTPK